jgi:hypothetical protein
MTHDVLVETSINVILQHSVALLLILYNIQVDSSSLVQVLISVT